MPIKIEYPVYVILRLTLGGLFIWASLDKIIDPVAFAEVITNYRILPPVFINPFALMLPWVELLCGISLFSGYLVKGSTMTLNLLIIIFTIAIGINMIRGVDISCGCFSNSLTASKHMARYLIRDIFLLVSGIWIFYYQLKQEEISSLKAI